MIRTAEQWKAILDEKTPKEAAKRILSDITHYMHGRSYENADIEQLANALLAYASLGVPKKDN